MRYPTLLALCISLRSPQEPAYFLKDKPGLQQYVDFNRQACSPQGPGHYINNGPTLTVYDRENAHCNPQGPGHYANNESALILLI